MKTFMSCLPELEWQGLMNTPENPGYFMGYWCPKAGAGLYDLVNERKPPGWLGDRVLVALGQDPGCLVL